MPRVFNLAVLDLLVLADEFGGTPEERVADVILSDTIEFLELFDSNLQGYIVNDQLFWIDEFIISNPHKHYADDITFSEVWKNIKDSVFTDCLFLVDAINPLIISDLITFSEYFEMLYSSAWGEEFLFTEEFILTGSFSQKLTDNLNLQSNFTYYIVPPRNIC